MSTAKEKEQALHLTGIAVATVLAITAIVLAAACPPQDLTPARARMFAASSEGAL
ncbi:MULTISPECIES: hypothetical protein [unclassified Caulobacter]|jgi:hypothetical protein|uniref:hypothetical protein n=1 Tax=unclassified Caulobacter TaxID=2648921 RepID=UPI000AB9B60C|nr:MULTISPECIES: hypothetical protein [unclassified Caulobacter]